MTTMRTRPPCRRFSRATPRGRGFTLLELMVAIAMAGLVLVGLNFFVFSMGEIWGRGSDSRLFDQHVRGVARFLQHELRAARNPYQADGSTPSFEILEIKPSGGVPERLVSYTILDPDRLMTWIDRPLPEVVCSLQVRDGKGLFLLYHSRLEKRFEDESPREALISPFVESLAYQYYDEDYKRWTQERMLKRDNGSDFLVPQRLVLKFAYRGFTRELVLSLSETEEGLPRFP